MSEETRVPETTAAEHEEKPPVSLHDLIDKGVRTVEEIHTSIANLPLDMIEQIKPLEAPAREVKKVQKRVIGTVYDLIVAINHHVAALAGSVTEPPKKG
ncbi:MAG TPA: hypothetical protein VGQ83_18525 [Polyangia bacterium]|jgi:hypothetical protein